MLNLEPSRLPFCHLSKHWRCRCGVLLACLSVIWRSLTSDLPVSPLPPLRLSLSLSGRRALGEVSVEGRWDHVSPDPGEEPCPGWTASAGLRGSSTNRKPPQCDSWALQGWDSCFFCSESISLSITERIKGYSHNSILHLQVDRPI